MDHALRHGDSLVGLTRRQIEALQWEPTGAVVKGLNVREHVDRVFELRERIREADEKISDWTLRDLWDEAWFELSKVRLFGDLVLAAFFQGDKPRDRERKRAEYATAILKGDAERHREWLNEWRTADKPLVPFHWEIEFPEAFERENAGFDAVVGNPPFLAGRSISSTYSNEYLDFLKADIDESAGQADLVAYFFRRAFQLIREHGAIGLLATNTVAQGDTRLVGLTALTKLGAIIYAATKRIQWPGSATVIASAVHLTKGEYSGTPMLDAQPVDRISAFLLSKGPDDNPTELGANRGICFKGVMPSAPGFLFEDEKTDANPLADMTRLISQNPSNAERIKPFIGGDEILTDPQQRHCRFVIDFYGVREHERQKWPDLLKLLEEKVYKLRRNGRLADLMPWEFERDRPDLREKLKDLTRVLVFPSPCGHAVCAFVPRDTLVSNPHCVFTQEDFAFFALIQSRVHEVWARMFSSSLKDDLRYTPKTTFQTFPLPPQSGQQQELERVGKNYYQFRVQLMVKNNEGLTATYNRFHEATERDPDIIKLRALHADMDRAVLQAYCWTDIKTECEFLLDYEIDADEWGDKKKPYRYHWSDDVREEVLARLLELNRERAKEEARSAATATKQRNRKSREKRASRIVDSGDMFS